MQNLRNLLHEYDSLLNRTLSVSEFARKVKIMGMLKIFDDQLELKNFEGIKEGTILQNLGSGMMYVVTYRLNDKSLILTRTVHASNPSEWKVVS